MFKRVFFVLLMEPKQLYKLFRESEGICTDSRKTKEGQLFFALSGQNFNGNEFAQQAISQGASYAVIDKQEFRKNEQYIVVPDVLKSLQELGQYHRIKLGIPVIAITGSNGKTTTKELISTVLQKKFNVSYTQGNLNNHIGVPLTLLTFTRETEIGVVEMGANHEHEIEQLCRIAQPDFGIITNIGKAHLEGFGSYEGVIRAKNELYEFCKINGKKVFVHGNDELLMKLSSEINRIIYGSSDSFEISGSIVSSDPCLSLQWKNQLINSQLVGEYNFPNLMAAVALGSYFKIKPDEINEAISNYSPQNNRSQLKKTSHNTLYIDAYNANPSSMELSILNFSKIKGQKKILILGDMFELGESSATEHQKILDLVASLKFEKAFFIGKHFYSLKNSFVHTADFFPTTDELNQFLTQKQISGYDILLKASRGIQLERALGFL